jgi:hypothetical protein
VIVGFAARVAVLLPVAQLTVLDGMGIGAVGVRGEHALEAALHAAVVGGEVGETEALARVRAENDVDPLRHRTLLCGEQLGVETELEQEIGLHPPRELRVGHLIAPLAQRRPLREALQEVGVTAPALAVEEDGLVDNLGALPHRCAGALGTAFQPVEARLGVDLHDPSPVGA